MAANTYHFVTHWQFDASAQEVAAILEDVGSLADWWPSVYLHVEILADGDDDGIGKKVRLHTRGWLPYTLRWDFEVTEARAPWHYRLEARGDFDGTGIWTLEERDAGVGVTYDWKIRADKPLLRYLSFFLKPVFSANHHWAMREGERALNAELVRRRTTAS